ncbi:uncharacterized protein IAS62_006170 [Cryptococcus decagattii]|uniref:GH16 domain-containing protein n=1 Tax=Cryptococcus decagattii TaxID=1859122 RepID=A0ABZ2B1Z4_9TREE
MRPALTLLTLLPYLGMTFANTCPAAGTSAVATASGDALGTGIWFNTDSSAAHATLAAASVLSGDHSSVSRSATPETSLVQSAAYPQRSQMGTDLVLSNPFKDCECGYSISSLNNEYFPYKFAYTFSALSDGDAKDGLAAAGWVVNDGKYWLNHSISTQYADELDIEVISSTIDTDGVWYSNWPPNGNPNNPDGLTSAHTHVPFPDISTNDPRKTYNNYTIAWLSSSTTRYYNGVKQDSPTENRKSYTLNSLLKTGQLICPTYEFVEPEHTMIFTINNWSNGGTGWTHGPPTGEDSDLRIKSVLLYYRTQDVWDMAALDSSCTDSDVCKV